tara:strand:- start:934 stop:1566 length:633 start_codon:yes stop_codon:yes gene_type:complete
MKRQIKSVKRSTRYKDRILIKLYDGELIKTSEEFFVKNSLKVDDFIDQKVIDSLQNDIRIRQALDTAYKFLSFRVRSSYEVAQKLSQKDYNKLEISEVIKKLISMNYLDDSEFADIFTRDKFKVKKHGPLNVINGLKKHRISDETIHNTIFKYYTNDSITELIEFHLIKKKKLSTKTYFDENKQKIISMLYRKGFSYEDINRVLVEKKFI